VGTQWHDKKEESAGCSFSVPLIPKNLIWKSEGFLEIKTAVPLRLGILDDLSITKCYLKRCVENLEHYERSSAGLNDQECKRSSSSCRQ